MDHASLTRTIYWVFEALGKYTRIKNDAVVTIFMRVLEKLIFAFFVLGWLDLIFFDQRLKISSS